MTSQGWVGDAAQTLPTDADDAVLVGRVWNPRVNGPSPVVVRGGELHDISSTFPTVHHLLEADDPVAALRRTTGESVGELGGVLRNTASDDPTPEIGRILAPVDLQAVKAAGVTFAASMIERLIEERVKGDAAAAADARRELESEFGEDLREIRPGSERAAALRDYLLAKGAWSQYLEVGLGEDAELFTKAQPMSSIGTASDVGVLRSSEWNNPEPEVVLALDSRGRVKGATLGNDVNLRDVEGRSALLLSRAKDNNASCAIGPFIRLFDSHFDMDAVRTLDVSLQVEDSTGTVMQAVSPMREISRDPAELVDQLMASHDYPDGAVLMLGTMFAPVVDRDGTGNGFTHHADDIVRISADTLGSLQNRVRPSEACAPWTFGVAALMLNLAGRGLLTGPAPAPATGHRREESR